MTQSIKKVIYSKGLEGVSDNFTRHDLQFSMGVSYFPQNARSSKKLMEQAIKALEDNQKKRKNK